jgi:hypothetical protein
MTAVPKTGAVVGCGIAGVADVVVDAAPESGVVPVVVETGLFAGRCAGLMTNAFHRYSTRKHEKITNRTRRSISGSTIQTGLRLGEFHGDRPLGHCFEGTGSYPAAQRG